jgi:membrane protease YdiL (CAAX protease family)
MQGSYIDCARLGQAGWRRYLVGTLFILGVWFTLGTLLSAAAIAVFAPSGVSFEQAVEEPALLGELRGFVAVMLQFIPFFIACLAAPVLFHDRSPRTLVTAAERVSWGRIRQGFVLWFGLVLVFEAIPYLADPGSYTVQGDWRNLLLFLPLAAILVPIQTTAEELFFRGYLLQWLSLRTRNLTGLAVFSGLIFTLPHLLNPETEANIVLAALNFFTVGFILAYAALQDGRLELAIGAHFANNVYATTVVTFEDSSLETPALFFTTQWDPLLSLIQVLAAGVLFVVIAARWQRPASEPTTSAQ